MRGNFLLIAILVFAPLVRGGNRPLALLFLELAALVLALFIVQKPDFFRQLSRPFLGLLLVMVLLPLVQLIPLPFSIWSILPGHDQYAQALAAASSNVISQPRAFSLVPSLTEYSWLALLPPLTVFLYTISLSSEKLLTLTRIFLGLATLQALLGLVQYGGGPESLFRFGNEDHFADGTYANRDHLAGLLEMALPLGLALLTATLGHARAENNHSRNWRSRLAQLVSARFNRTIIFAFVSIVLLLGLIFTQSKTGVVLGMVVIFLSAVAFARRLGGTNVYGMIGTFTAVGMMLAVEIGLVPVLERFAQLDPLKDGRWSIYASVSQAIGEFFPLGSGIGTFNQAYLRFHAPDFVGVFINRAHNDYLEWVMEGGIIAAVLILGFFVLYLKRWLQVWSREHWRTFNFIQVGAGIGLFAMMLHTLVDFNLHIPANQIYFAFLAALFFHHAAKHEIDSEPVASGHDQREPAERKLDPATPPSPRTYPVQPGPNPFAE
jgi:O-antigen ligase